jgi:hypothetical protein
MSLLAKEGNKPNLIEDWDWITPEIAQFYLDTRYPNRNLRPRHVETLALDMRSGLWKTTHQGIAFAWVEERQRWEMVDGQHRMAAIVLSDTPQWVHTTWGVAIPDVKNVDTHGIRTYANWLQLDDHTNSTIIASSVRVFAQAEAAWERNLKISSAASLQLSREQLEKFRKYITERVPIEEVADAGKKLNRLGQINLQPSIGAGFYALARISCPNDTEIINEFVDELMGINSGPGKAAWVFGKKLADLKASRAKALEILAILIVAYRRKVEALNHNKPEEVTYLKPPLDGTLPTFVQVNHGLPRIGG